MVVTLNIGQNNNKFSHNQMVSLVRMKFGGMNIRDLEKTATYKSEEEPTTMVSFETNEEITSIVAITEELCSILTQESIALKTEEYKMLVFNREYKGEVFNFDDKFFVEL